MQTAETARRALSVMLPAVLVVSLCVCVLLFLFFVFLEFAVVLMKELFLDFSEDVCREYLPI